MAEEITPIPTEPAETPRLRRRRGPSRLAALSVLIPLGVMACALIAVTGAGYLVLTHEPEPLFRSLGVAVADEAGLLAVGGLGLAAWVFGAWVLRDRLRVLLHVRGALAAYAGGERDGGTLAISADSPMGRAWNGVLDWRQDMQDEAVLQRIASAGTSSDDGAGKAYCDALWQGVLVVDEHLMVRYANGAAAILLRKKRDALENSDVRHALTDESVLKTIVGAVETGSRQRQVQDVGDAADCNANVLRYSVRAIGHDKERRVLVVIEDVTQQRVAEHVQHAFVAQAAHELRTPLTNIKLYIDQLIEEDLSAEERGTALNVLNQESSRLDRLVSDMLSISEIQSGQLNAEMGDVRLAPMFESLKADFGAAANEKQLTLDFEMPPKFPQVVGDREKLDVLMHNLLGNAIKYTPSGGSVRVAVREETGRLIVEFIDTGIGIAEEEQDRIFERFVRANDTRVRDITGTGLGLALASEIAKLHGGTIKVHSELDVGSTFTFWLPISVNSMANAA